MDTLQSIGWIYGPSLESDNNPEIIYFKKEIVLDSVPNNCILDISADAKYKLYINNQLVNVGPQKGDKLVWFYDTLDIVEHLTTGTNTVLVEVMTIPDKPRGGNYSFGRTRTPGLYIQGPLGLKADSSWEFYKSSYKTIKGRYPLSPPIYF